MRRRAPLALLCSVMVLYSRPSSASVKPNLCQPGDIILGGLFSLHPAEAEVEDSVTRLRCGWEYSHSVVLVEAMHWAIDQINHSCLLKKYADPQPCACYPKGRPPPKGCAKFRPKPAAHQLSLGYNIQGTCDDSAENMFYALDAFSEIDVRRDALLHGGARNDSAQCSGTFGALVGPSSTAGSASVASLFRLDSIPVISYSASSSELSDHERFPSFFRTVYDDGAQAKALAELIAELGWNYVAVVGSDDVVGRQGVYDFKQALWNHTGRCISKELYLGMEAESLGEVMENLEAEVGDGRPRSNVTLLFMDWAGAVRVLKAAANSSVLADATFLGVDEWTANVSMTLDVPGFLPSHLTRGVLATQISRPTPKRFIAGLMHLEPRLRADEWFYQYVCAMCLPLWGLDPALCRQLGFSGTKKWVLNHTCTGAVYPEITVMVLEQKRISNVISAVYAAAFALDDLYQRDLINMEADGQYSIDYEDMVDSIAALNVSHVPVLCNDYPPIRFDAQGNLRGPAFELHNFYQGPKEAHAIRWDMGNCVAESREGHTRWSHSLSGPANDSVVGRWEDGGAFVLNHSAIHWRSGAKPDSSCSRPCLPGQKTVYAGSECCWSCEPCPAGHWNNASMSTECWDCPLNHHTSTNRTACYPNTITYIRANEPLGLANIILALLGELLVLISAAFSFRYRHHPYLNDQTLKTVLHWNCAVCFFYATFHVSAPTELCCAVRHVIWEVGITGHAVAAFFTTNPGRAASGALVAKLGVARRHGAHVAWVGLTGLGAGLWTLSALLWPAGVGLVDLGAVTGKHQDVSFADCAFASSLVTFLLFFGYAGVFLVAGLVIVFREERLRKRAFASSNTRRQPDEREYRPPIAERVPQLHSRLILNSSYVVVLVIGGLTPLYLTMDDPWSKNLTLLIGGFALNSIILGLYLLPRAQRVMADVWRGGSGSRHSSFGGVYIVSGSGRSHRLSRSESRDS